MSWRNALCAGGLPRSPGGGGGKAPHGARPYTNIRFALTTRRCRPGDPDLTYQTGYLGHVIQMTIETEMSKEAISLRNMDRARQGVENHLEGPNADIDRIIRSIRENRWTLSNTLIKAFPQLADPALAAVSLVQSCRRSMRSESRTKTNHPRQRTERTGPRVLKMSHLDARAASTAKLISGSTGFSCAKPEMPKGKLLIKVGLSLVDASVSCCKPPLGRTPAGSSFGIARNLPFVCGGRTGLGLSVLSVLYAGKSW